MPPASELLFMNAHHHEMSMLVDISNHVRRRGEDVHAPAPRDPHDYTRTPTHVLVGFLRACKARASIPLRDRHAWQPWRNPRIQRQPGPWRTAVAGDWGGKLVRPYAFALLPELDRLAGSASHGERADVLQIFSIALHFALLKTIDLPACRLLDGREVPGSEHVVSGPRVLPTSSVFLSRTFYRLSEIGTAEPRLDTFFALDTPPPTGPARSAGHGPVVFGHYSDGKAAQRRGDSDIANPLHARCSASGTPQTSTRTGWRATRSPTRARRRTRRRRGVDPCASMTRTGSWHSTPHLAVRGKRLHQSQAAILAARSLRRGMGGTPRCSCPKLARKGRRVTRLPVSTPNQLTPDSPGAPVRAVVGNSCFALLRS